MIAVPKSKIRLTS